MCDVKLFSVMEKLPQLNKIGVKMSSSKNGNIHGVTHTIEVLENGNQLLTINIKIKKNMRESQQYDQSRNVQYEPTSAFGPFPKTPRDMLKFLPMVNQNL